MPNEFSMVLIGSGEGGSRGGICSCLVPLSLPRFPDAVYIFLHATARGAGRLRALLPPRRAAAAAAPSPSTLAVPLPWRAAN